MRSEPPTTPSLPAMKWLNLNPAESCADQHRAALAEAGKMRSWIDSRVSLVLRAIDADSNDVLAASDALAEATGVSSRAAKVEASFARQLGELTATAVALAAGEITREHASKIAALNRRSKKDRKAKLHSDEAGLIAAAESQTPEEFGKALANWERAESDDEGVSDEERRRRNRKLKLFGDDDNMTKIHGQLDPESAQTVTKALDQIIGEMWRAENRKTEEDHLPHTESKSGIRHADALVEMARRALNITPEVGRKTRQSVGCLIDHQTLTVGPHDNTVCETGNGAPISPATARRIACDAGIIPIVLSGTGQPLDVGRAKRLATSLTNESPYAPCTKRVPPKAATCHSPGAKCTTSSRFEHNGPTDLENLVPLCSKHHHLIHDGNWDLIRDPLNPIRVLFKRSDEQNPAPAQHDKDHRTNNRRRRKTETPVLV